MAIGFVIRNGEGELLNYDWNQFIDDFSRRYLEQVSAFSTKSTKITLMTNIAYDLLKEFKKLQLSMPAGAEDQ